MSNWKVFFESYNLLSHFTKSHPEKRKMTNPMPGWSLCFEERAVNVFKKNHNKVVSFLKINKGLLFGPVRDEIKLI